MPTNEPNVLHRKIAVLGFPCVGKSSLTMRFVDGTFPDAYDTTIEDYHVKSHMFMGRKYVLKITDTAGQQEYSLFPRSCSLDIDGYVLVYAINDRRSFDILRTIYDKIMENVGESVPMIIVGNKLDLQYASRVVRYDQGQKLAEKWDADFVEVSAKDNMDIQKIFERLLKAIEHSKGNIVAGKNNSCVIS